MTTQTKEAAFEATVESMLIESGWVRAGRHEWEVERALLPARAVSFMRETQPDQWEQVAALHDGDVEPRIIEALAKELDTKGSLHVLRHGFKFYGQTFRLAYFKPAHGLNYEALARFERNELSVTRQARLSSGQGSRDRPVVRAQWSADCDLRAQESDDRPDLEERRSAVQTGPRGQRTGVPFPEARARPLRRRSQRDPHDDPA